MKEKNWSWVPGGGLIPKQTGQLTVDHMMTVTLWSLKGCNYGV
jgi:hypothetical protein